jgi:hypothetical protein
MYHAKTKCVLRTAKRALRQKSVLRQYRTPLKSVLQQKAYSLKKRTPLKSVRGALLGWQ